MGQAERRTKGRGNRWSATRAWKNLARSLDQRCSRDWNFRDREAACCSTARVGFRKNAATCSMDGTLPLTRTPPADNAASRQWRTANRLVVRKRMAAEFQLRPARWRGSMNAPFAMPIRTAPHNIEAEQALLGAILVNNEAFYRVSD